MKCTYGSAQCVTDNAFTWWGECAGGCGDGLGAAGFVDGFSVEADEKDENDEKRCDRGVRSPLSGDGGCGCCG